MKKALDQLVDLRPSAIIVIDMQNDFCNPNGAVPNMAPMFRQSRI